MSESGVGYRERRANSASKKLRAAWDYGASRRGFTPASAATFALVFIATLTLSFWTPVRAQTDTRAELVDALSRLETQLTELTNSQLETASKDELLELTAQLGVLTMRLEVEQERARNAALTQQLARRPVERGTNHEARLAQLVEQQNVLDAQFVITAEQHDEICLGK